MDRIDNHLAVETPEGVEFELELSGITLRTFAFLIDSLIKAAVVMAFSFGLFILGGFGQGLLLLIAFGALWLYGPLFEVFYHGQTPGKKILGIRVVNQDGTPVGWYGAIIRNLLRVVDFLPFGYVAGIIAMVISGKFQRLGDLAGDTVVVYERSAFTEEENRALPPAEPVQLSVVLSPREQEAIVDFSERSSSLGPDRSAELAEILAPMAGAPTGPEAARTLHGVAHRIVRWG